MKGLAEISWWCSPRIWLWVHSELREKSSGPRAELELSPDSLQGGLCVSSSPGSPWTCCLKIADPVQLLLGSGSVLGGQGWSAGWSRGWRAQEIGVGLFGLHQESPGGSSVIPLHKGDQSWATKTRVQHPVQPWASHFTSLPQFPRLENGDNDTHLPHRGVVRTHKLL